MASGWLAQLQDELTSQLEDALSQCYFSSGSVEEVRLECITNDFVGGDRCSTGFREVFFLPMGNNIVEVPLLSASCGSCTRRNLLIHSPKM